MGVVYYPFGLTFNSYSRENSTPQDYKYNGKEEQNELGLGWLDYGSRMYQPELARWAAIDYMSEKYNSHSPYTYCLNSPVLFVDPDGQDVYLLIWYTADGSIGHAGIATDNYKTIEEKDADGNVTTKQVADGTVTYYDFFQTLA